MTPLAEKVSMFTRQISDAWLSTLIYGVHIVGIAYMSNKEHVNLWPKILNKTCSSLVKIIYDGEIILREISTKTIKLVNEFLISYRN